jgi:hypothetical protein
MAQTVTILKDQLQGAIAENHRFRVESNEKSRRIEDLEKEVSALKQGKHQSNMADVLTKMSINKPADSDHDIRLELGSVKEPNANLFLQTHRAEKQA